jgi:hypothetical protein
LYYFHKKLKIVFLGGFFIANPAFISLTIVLDRHRFAADPDQTPFLMPIRKNQQIFLLLKAVPVLAFLSVS